jgi:hypothetical protein
LARDSKQVLLRRDVDLVWRQSRHRQYYPITIFIVAANVERWRRFEDVAAHLSFQSIEQFVKPNGRLPIGRKIKVISHFQILLLKQFGS